MKKAKADKKAQTAADKKAEKEAKKKAEKEAKERAKKKVQPVPVIEEKKDTGRWQRRLYLFLAIVSLLNVALNIAAQLKLFESLRVISITGWLVAALFFSFAAICTPSKSAGEEEPAQEQAQETEQSGNLAEQVGDSEILDNLDNGGNDNE